MFKVQSQKITEDIIKRAASGEHVKFEFIRDWQTYRRRKANRTSIRLVIAGLNHSLAVLLRKHCEQVIDGSGSAVNLLVRNVVQTTKSFYEIELAVIEDMINEYETYLANGNWLNAYWGEIRPISELYDSRK